jgi:hypothetical protein
MSVESYFRTHFCLAMPLIPLLAIHFRGSYQTLSGALKVQGTGFPLYLALTRFLLLHCRLPSVVWMERHGW